MAGQVAPDISEAARARPTETILTWGYDVVAMGGELPTREDLDAISTTHPIVVWDAVEKAMRMVTVDAAYTLGVDDRVGSIETGKFADFVVLDADPREVDPTTIKDIGVVATIVAGQTTLTSKTRDPNW